jgi:uncharacterized membrane protein
MWNQDILSAIDVVEQSVKLAELDTTAEFKVHLELQCPGEVQERAVAVFKQLKLHKTSKRNSVLIYVALEIRKFHIIFDKGIQDVADSEIIEKSNYILINRLRNNEVIEGISEVIEYLGNELGKYFPYSPCDKNELGDEISMEGLRKYEN